MFRDRFHGGPLDGQVQDADPLDNEARIDAASGATYVRHPDLDDEEHRAWRYTTAGQGQFTGAEVAIADPDGLTLRQLENFLAVARQTGWSFDTQVRAVVSFKGRIRRIEVKP